MESKLSLTKIYHEKVLHMFENEKNVWNENCHAKTSVTKKGYQNLKIKTKFQE